MYFTEGSGSGVRGETVNFFLIKAFLVMLVKKNVDEAGNLRNQYFLNGQLQVLQIWIARLADLSRSWCASSRSGPAGEAARRRENEASDFVYELFFKKKRGSCDACEPCPGLVFDPLAYTFQ